MFNAEAQRRRERGEFHSLRTLRLSALAPLGLARYKTRAPLARRLRASALKNELPFLGLATKYRRRQEDVNGLRRAKHKPKW